MFLSILCHTKEICHYTEEIRALSRLWTAPFLKKKRVKCYLKQYPFFPEENTQTNMVAQNVEYPQSHSPFYNQRPSVTMSDLLQILNVPHLAVVEDLELILRRSHSFTQESLGRARYLTQNDHFRYWVHPSQSYLLLVDGHFERNPQGRISAMSVLCASLSTALSAQPRTSVLSFFCGQHVEVTDPLCGPVGMLRSLIMQLILYSNNDDGANAYLHLGFFASASPQLVFDLRDWQVGALCYIFKQLIKQLPTSMTIHVILDGIPYYEGEE